MSISGKKVKVVAVLGFGGLTVGAFLLLSAHLRAGSAYRLEREALDATLLTAQVLDERASRFLEEVQQNWEQIYTALPGGYGEIMVRFDLEPSVAHYLRIVSEPLPQFCWLWPPANRRSWELAEAKRETIPRATDGVAHVSPEGDLVMVQPNENQVMFFIEEPGGLRETGYVNPNARGENSP